MEQSKVNVPTNGQSKYVSVIKKREHWMATNIDEMLDLIRQSCGAMCATTIKAELLLVKVGSEYVLISGDAFSEYGKVTILDLQSAQDLIQTQKMAKCTCPRHHTAVTELIVFRGIGEDSTEVRLHNKQELAVALVELQLQLLNEELSTLIGPKDCKALFNSMLSLVRSQVKASQ